MESRTVFSLSETLTTLKAKDISPLGLKRRA
nr:MAG TPA: hypothetical protein [Caudoviricetes sp.]